MQSMHVLGKEYHLKVVKTILGFKEVDSTPRLCFLSCCSPPGFAHYADLKSAKLPAVLRSAEERPSVVSE